MFVNLDPADPNRIFFVILDVIDDKVWNGKYTSSIVVCILKLKIKQDFYPLLFIEIHLYMCVCLDFVPSSSQLLLYCHTVMWFQAFVVLRCFVRLLGFLKLLVYDCNPHVSGLQNLLEELNATNNLSSFCKQLRGKFKDLTCKQ